MPIAGQMDRDSDWQHGACIKNSSVTSAAIRSQKVGGWGLSTIPKNYIYVYKYVRIDS